MQGFYYQSTCWYNHFGKLKIYTETNHSHTYNLAMLLYTCSKEMSVYVQKDIFSNVQSRFIHNSPKFILTQASINFIRDTYIVVSSYVMVC